MRPSFEKSVFINCPFDKGYRKLFHAIIFAVYDSGFEARSALEIDNAGQNRLEKIVQIISSCKYGIHDISRTQLDPRTRLPRFNMPFEFGLDLGCSRYGNRLQKSKKLLVFDKQRFRYQKFLSDIGGNDIHAHNNSPNAAIGSVRNWLRTHLSKAETIPGPEAMCARFQAFENELPQLGAQLRLKVNEIQFVDYVNIVEIWLRRNP